ncbi:MAG: ATP-binding protein [Acidobacteriota bacterium]|nr:ATP-binding protein [Acidobacteriota bacterium]
MTGQLKVQVWPRLFRDHSHCLLRLTIISGLLSAMLIIIFALWLKQPAPDSEKTILANLNKATQEIHQDFSRLLDLLHKRQKQLLARPLPEDPWMRFEFFKKSGVNPGLEGVASLDEKLNPEVWYGSIANLKALLPGWPQASADMLAGSFVVQDHASTYLISLKPAGQNTYLAVFELLAFQPQFQSTYLHQYIRLESVREADADLDFWEYFHDTEALNRLFERNRDAYLSHQREERESRTLYFPLRNEKGKILATVTLNSLRLQKQKLNSNQLVRLLSIILALVALLSFFFWLTGNKSPSFWPSGLARWLLGLATLSTIRYLLAILVRYKPFVTWQLFSPREAAFLTVKNLTGSPADIFLTYLFIFFLALFSLKSLKPGSSFSTRQQPEEAKKDNILGMAASSLLFVLGFQAFIWSLKQIVACTSFNLLNYNFNSASLLIYLSLFLAGLSFIFFPLVILRKIFFASSARATGWIACLILILIFELLACLLIKPAGSKIAWQIVFLLSFLCITALIRRHNRYILLSLFLIVLLQFASVRVLTMARTQHLTENVLSHLVSSQKTWAEMTLKQSLLELQRQTAEIHSFFSQPADKDFARSLWNRTFLARLNWNSCLYLQSGDKKLLSSFALNMPVFTEQTDDLETSIEPVYTEEYLEILGQERHFLIGYQDFVSDHGAAGRLVIWVSLDPTLLPFTNTANPYFELLRLNTLPSLQHFPVSLAVFNAGGQPLFNQRQPAFPLEPELRRKIKEQPDGLWTVLHLNNTNYRAYCLTLEDGYFYVFYQPPASYRQLVTGFLKLFFLYMIFFFLLIVPGAARRKQWWPDFRSFSARVYVAFLTVALVPLFFFIFFTQTMVERIFADRFVNEATDRAYFARSILYDFTSLQEPTEQPSELSQDLVFWISSTLNNDVNLYRQGLFLSSSRREFFETGLLSDLIDGEVYSQIVYGHQPLVVSRKSYGQFSYQTLTIPFNYQQHVYFLSLPFPFERQEISQATGELLEFFIFSSVFFIGLIAFFASTIKRMIIIPINKLIRATQEVGLGHLEVRVDYQAQDELQSLIDGFNTMVENLREHEKELAELSQKVAWAEMARRVAHEIKNPLTPIQLSAEHILKVHEDRHPEFDQILKESISYIISEVENLRRIAQEFMTFARESGSVRENFDLANLVKELVQPYKSTLEGRITITFRKSGEDFTLFGDREKMKVALRNLLINSIEAIKGKGQIDFVLKASPETVRLEIKDNGTGIPAEMAEHIFEPNFSTKEKGTGLGLAICKRIIDENGGSIQVESKPDQGTRVILTFPRAMKNQPD